MPAAVSRSRKSKIIRSCVIFLLSFGIILGIRYLRATAYSAERYPDRQTIEGMFAENREEFDRVAEIFVRSDLFQHLRERDQNAIFRPSIPEWKGHLTKEEYETIRGFFHQYGPYEISQSLGNPKFVFLATDVTVKFHFYAGEPGDSQERFLIYIEQFGDEIIDLQDGWYCVIRANDAL